MFTTARIKEYLAASPFRPFRIHLSDGSQHDVPHPEFAWAIGSRVYVAKIVKGRAADDPYVEEIAVLHVASIEPLNLPKKARAVKRTKK